MNRARRNEIKDVIDQLKYAIEQLELIASDEQDSFDNLPESFQEGERGDQMQENVNDLESSSEAIGTVVDWLTDIVNR